MCKMCVVVLCWGENACTLFWFKCPMNTRAVRLKDISYVNINYGGPG